MRRYLAFHLGDFAKGQRTIYPSYVVGNFASARYR